MPNDRPMPKHAVSTDASMKRLMQQSKCPWIRSLTELMYGMPGTRYNTLVPSAMSGVSVQWNIKPAQAMTDEQQAAQSTARRISHFHSLCKAFLIQKPLTVAINTMSMALQSPSNKRQNEALARPVSSVTNQGLSRGFFMMLRNSFFASSSVMPLSRTSHDKRLRREHRS